MKRKRKGSDTRAAVRRLLKVQRGLIVEIGQLRQEILRIRDAVVPRAVIDPEDFERRRRGG